jgi:hypothetical protein
MERKIFITLGKLTTLIHLKKTGDLKRIFHIHRNKIMLRVL